ncbi:glycosyltransferase family 2 protein [Streptomyces sp. NPDC049687]|uniref:glycosyltransferase family 2 protein n=1 Tax=Streptomyces sp. NPDC049687 TaxID=3365596 RepID=UPI00378C0F72
MSSLSVVIPALNEAENLPGVFATIPVEELTSAGWGVEVIIADNGSTDGTAEIAESYGARVVHQPLRGYGNAYKAGIAAARGEVIATGDADCTYPFDDLPRLLSIVDEHQVEFLNTNRLGRENREAMKPSHTVANHALSLVSRKLFKSTMRDSQSGMWVFRRYIWETLKVTSDGMGFSQEIKNAAVREGFRCMEVPIEYRPRGGDVKLNAFSDGVSNVAQLFRHRLRDNALRTDTRAQWHDRSTRPVPPPLMPAQREVPRGAVDRAAQGTVRSGHSLA